MEHHRVLPSKSNKKRYEGDSRYRTIIIIQEMKKKLIFIQLCIVLILFCINVKGQNASLNKALEISYYNFLRTVPDRWKDKFDRKDFYLVNNYNPYGFNVQRIKGWKNLHLKNGKLIIGKNLVGYPLLQMIGRDTLLIEIGQIFCRQDKMWAFTDGYTSLFNVDNKTFKAIKISQKDLYYKPENAKKQGKLIDFDSIYDKAVNRAIGYLGRSGVPRHLIYINKEYFPSWFFKNQQENVIEGSEYKKYIKKNYYVIGWPILFIKKGNIIVRLHCSYKYGIRKKIISEVQYTFDENKNKWTLHNENSTTMSIKMKLVDEHSSSENLPYIHPQAISR